MPLNAPRYASAPKSALISTGQIGHGSESTSCPEGTTSLLHNRQSGTFGLYQQRGSGSSPHRNRRRLGGQGAVRRLRKGTGEVSVTAGSCDVTRGLVRTRLPAVKPGQIRNRGKLFRQRATHSRCPLPHDRIRARCSVPASPGSGATMSQAGPNGPVPHLDVVPITDSTGPQQRSQMATASRRSSGPNSHYGWKDMATGSGLAHPVSALILGLTLVSRRVRRTEVAVVKVRRPTLSLGTPPNRVFGGSSESLGWSSYGQSIPAAIGITQDRAVLDAHDSTVRQGDP